MNWHLGQNITLNSIVHIASWFFFQDKAETAALQWQCFKLLMYNHFCLQVGPLVLRYIHKSSIIFEEFLCSVRNTDKLYTVSLQMLRGARLVKLL